MRLRVLSMKSVLNYVAMLLLALWLPATQHCALEAAGLLDHECEAASAQPEHCDADACKTIESGNFVKQLGVPRITAAPDALFIATILISSVPEPGTEAAAILPHASPPGLVALHRTWSFVRRAALSPRAPSLIG